MSFSKEQEEDDNSDIITGTITNNQIEEKMKNFGSYDDHDVDNDCSNSFKVGSYQGAGGGGGGGGNNNETSNSNSSGNPSSFSSFPHSYDYDTHERNKKKYGIDYTNIMDSNNFDTYGSIDIELMLQDEEEGEEKNIELKEDKVKGIEIKPIKNQINLFCYVPPKCGNNAFASFSGKSGFLNQRGYADTSLSLGYHLFQGNTFLCDWHTQDGTSKMSYGLCHTSSSKRSTYTEAKMHYPSASLLSSSSTKCNNPSLVLRSSTDVILNKVRGNMEMKFDNVSSSSLPLSLFDNEPSLLKLGLYTIHDSKKHALPHLQFNLNLFNRTNAINSHGTSNDPFPIQVKYIQPCPQKQEQSKKSSSTSQTELSFATGKQKRYQIQILFTQAFSKFSSFSTGMEMDSFKGLSWLMKWKRGDVSLNIPIRLSNIILGGYGKDGIGNCSSSIFGKNNVLYHVSASYVLFLSYVIDAIVSDVIHRATSQIMNGKSNNNGKNNSQSRNEEEQQQQDQHEQERLLSSLSLLKAKKDAELQMELMKRKSNMNKKNEEKKNGLVIQKAVYSIQNGNEDLCTSMDVSIQLQFWVSDSRLIITSNSKSHMLGFYDVAKGTSKSLTSFDDNDHKKSFGLLDLWKSLFQDNDETIDEELPFLMIRYAFNGILYDISILDNEALTLPNPRAVKVIEEVE